MQQNIFQNYIRSFSLHISRWFYFPRWTKKYPSYINSPMSADNERELPCSLSDPRPWGQNMGWNAINPHVNITSALFCRGHYTLRSTIVHAKNNDIVADRLQWRSLLTYLTRVMLFAVRFGKGSEKADENVVNVLYAIACHTIMKNDLHICNWRIKLVPLFSNIVQFDGFLKDCSISISNALDALQSCTTPSIWLWCIRVGFEE